MPRYYFDLDDGKHVRDHEGQEIEDFEAVRREAMRRFAVFAANPANFDGKEVVVVTVWKERQEITLTARMVFQINLATDQTKIFQNP